MVDAVARIVDTHTIVVMYGADLVRSLTADGVAAIETAEADALTAIGTAQSTAVTAVETAESDAIAAITPLVTQAEAAQTAAEAAQTAAETAETNAETAQAGAETAEAGAVAAKEAIEDTISVEWVYDLPVAPVHGQSLKWGPTREIATYDEGTDLWHRANGEPLSVVLDRFEGDAATVLGNHVGNYGRLPVGPYRPVSWSKQHKFTESLLNGDGTVSSTGTSFQSYATSSNAHDHYIRVRMTPDAGANEYGSVWTRSGAGLWTGLRIMSSGVMRIVRRDFNVDTIIAASEAIAGFDATEPHEFLIKTYAQTLDAIHVASGTRITAATPHANKHLIGIASSETTVTHGRLDAIPLGIESGLELAEGLKFMGLQVIGDVPEADMTDARDITGNGLLDFVSGTSENNATEGFASSVELWLQYERGKFERILIDQNADDSTTDRFIKLEGACFIKIDGVFCIVVVEQDDHKLWLYRPVDPTDYRGNWRRGSITGPDSRYAGQDVFVKEHNGRETLYATFEGTENVLIPPGDFQHGGVAVYEFAEGEDPTTLANVTEHQIWQDDASGAWAFGKRRQFLDLDEVGKDEYLIVGRRIARNSDSPGAITALKMPSDPLNPANLPWVATDIVVTGTDITNWDVGDFSGDGTGMDIAYTVLNDLNIYILRHSTGWTQTSFTPAAGTDGVWNVRSLPAKVNGRHAMIASIGSGGGATQPGGYYAIWWDGAAWASRCLKYNNWGHPAEDPRVPIFDLYGDGGFSVLLSESYGGELIALNFAAPTPTVPVGPALITSYSSEATTYFDALNTLATLPGDLNGITAAEYLEYLDGAIRRTVACGAWARDLARYLAVHSEAASLINIKNPGTYTLTKTGTVTFTPWRQWKGDGSTGYYATGLIPPAGGIALDNFRMGGIGLSNETDSSADMGSLNGSAYLRIRSAGSSFRKINGATGTGSLVAIAGIVNVPVYVWGQRRVAGESEAGQNGAVNTTTVAASSNLADELTLLRSSTHYSTRSLHMGVFGLSYTLGDMSHGEAGAWLSLAAQVGAIA